MRGSKFLSSNLFMRSQISGLPHSHARQGGWQCGVSPLGVTADTEARLPSLFGSISRAADCSELGRYPTTSPLGRALLTTGDRWLQETRVAKLDALPPRVHQVTSGQVSESPLPCQALKRAMILRVTSSIACCTSGAILAPGSNRRPSIP